MKTKALQVRLDPRLHERIGFFADAAGTSMNRLVIDAVNAHLQQVATQLDSELSETLRRVRSYARSEENVTRDLEAFVDAELSVHDPDHSGGD